MRRESNEIFNIRAFARNTHSLGCTYKSYFLGASAIVVEHSIYYHIFFFIDTTFLILEEVTLIASRGVRGVG